MKNRKRKNAQRYINKCVHALNKNIANDYLWRGRFVARQIDAHWEQFDDGSGGEFRVAIECRDKKTGYKRVTYMNNYDIDWRLWNDINDFITTYCHVWDDRKALFEDTTDYRKVK